MNLIVWLIVLTLSAQPTVANPLPKQNPRSIWQKLFVKPTPTPKKKSHKSLRKKPVVKQIVSKPIEDRPQLDRTPDGFFIVEPQWMANYWEQIAAWNYPIPDEKDIHFENGKYHVPATVYRHYDDMVAGRKASKKPNP